MPDLESWGEPTFADVVFRDVQIEYTGGGTADDAALPVRQPGVDARKLPAWGFFVRGVHDLTLERVSLTLREPDRRACDCCQPEGSRPIDAPSSRRRITPRSSIHRGTYPQRERGGEGMSRVRWKSSAVVPVARFSIMPGNSCV